LISSEEENISKRIRKYYTLTESGPKTAKEKVHEFLDFVSSLENKQLKIMAEKLLDTSPVGTGIFFIHGISKF